MKPKASSHRVIRRPEKAGKKVLVSARVSAATFEQWPRDQVSLGNWIDQLARRRGRRGVTTLVELHRERLRMAVWSAASLDRIARILTAGALATAGGRTGAGMVTTEQAANVLFELSLIREGLENTLKP
jgi:hypothetical protein